MDCRPRSSETGGNSFERFFECVARTTAATRFGVCGTQAAFEVLVGPLVLFFRYYSNLAQMIPRVLLVLIGSTVLVEQQFEFSASKGCADVLVLNSVPFLPLSGWLFAQVFVDILIVSLRLRRYLLLAPVVAAFGRGEGAESTKLRAKRPAPLSFPKWKFDIHKSVTRLVGCDLSLSLSFESLERVRQPLSRTTDRW